MLVHEITLIGIVGLHQNLAGGQYGPQRISASREIGEYKRVLSNEFGIIASAWTNLTRYLPIVFEDDVLRLDVSVSHCWFIAAALVDRFHVGVDVHHAFGDGIRQLKKLLVRDRVQPKIIVKATKRMIGCHQPVLCEPSLGVVLGAGPDES